MRVVNKKLWIITITLLVVIECVFTYLSVKSYSNKNIKEIKEENKVDKEMFSMYVENKDGEYVEYTDSEYYPIGLKYYFNEERSNCTDNKGKVVNNVISYNNNKITVSSNKTVYCYLYFDLDKVAPQVFTFYLGGSSNPAYTNSVNTKAYLNWSDNDIEKYCLTIGSDSTSCTWNSVSNSPMEIDYTLSSGDGTKTVNAYLKDMAGNISPKVSDSIVLDTAPPQVTASVNNNYSTNATMTITSNEAGTYCVNTSATSTTDCTFTGSITAGGSITTSAFTTKGDYYAHVTDGAGYVSHSSKVTIALSPPSLGEYIIDNSISGLDKTIIDGDTLYRFSGTSGNTGINNYICLGTTTKCASGSENMYRIIGVEPSTGYVKVIKQIKYGSTKWSSSSQVTWPNSDAYSTMVTWYNSVSFKSMIVSHTWNIGYVNGTANSYIGTRELVISYEDDTSTTAYVGMLALSDYYLAYQGDLHWHSNSNYTSNWIHLGNNGNTSDVEWTMTRYGIFGWGVYFRFAASGGVVGYTSVSNSLAVRPVFYLDSDIYRISGSGTSDDPFLVSE